MAATPEIRRVTDVATLCEAAAATFTHAAEGAVQATGRFTVALAGGSTPRGLYTLLATDATLRARIAWNMVHVFWGDERHVAPDHADSNFRMANDALLSHVPVDPSHVWRIKGEYVDASRAADEYERNLQDAFALNAGQLPRFDLVLLGMGDDGHTASLFPGTSALSERRRLVVANRVPKFQTDRITLTAPVLNNAACVMFLVQGAEKAGSLKAVLEGPFEPERLPAQLIRPDRGRLLWIVDRLAASSLTPAMFDESGS